MHADAPPADPAPPAPAADQPAGPPAADREITLEEWIAAGQACCGVGPGD